MPAGDLVTDPWHIELQGLLLGPATPYVIRSFNPWAAPVLRTSRQARGGQHGAFPARQLLGERRIPIELYIAASGSAAADAAAKRLLVAAFSPGELEVPLVWMEDDGVKYAVFGQPEPVDARVAPRIPSTARFVGTDPRIYGLAEHTGSVGFPTGGAGRTYPLTFPMVYGASGASGIVVADNAGLADAPWTASISGPWVNPTIQRVDTGDTISIGTTIAAGEELVISSRDRTVILNGTASRNAAVRPSTRWFSLAPGETSVRFGGSSGTGTAELAWRDTWLG